MKESDDVRRWIAERALKTSCKIIHMLNDELAHELRDVKREAITTVHSYALFEALCSVNCPINLHKATTDEFQAFCDLKTNVNPQFLELCHRIREFQADGSSGEPVGRQRAPIRKNVSGN